MRAPALSLVVALCAPGVCFAQHDAAMAAARAVAGAPTQAPKPAPVPAAPAAPAAVTPTAGVVAPPAAAPVPGAAASTPADAQAQQLEPKGFTYNAEGRRDPFVSLLRRGAGSDSKATGGAHASGLRALSAGEVTLKGTMASKGGYVAILQGSDAKNYVVHPGEQLLDGTVRMISADSLVILQQVGDPLSRETHREVRKVLRQTEEAR